MLRKILLLLISFSLLLLGFAKTPSPARATATCTITHTPTEIHDTDSLIDVVIDTHGAILNPVKVVIKPPGQSYRYVFKDGGTDAFQPDASGIITLEKLTVQFNTNGTPPPNNPNFKSGAYSVKVINPDGHAADSAGSLCTNPSEPTFEVKPSDTGSDNYCIARLNPANGYIAPGAVSVIVKFIRPLDSRDAANERRHSFILTGTQIPEYRSPDIYTTTEMENPGFAIPGQLNAGTYRVQVIENHIDGPIYNISDQGRSCFSNYFLIGTEEHPGHECTADNSDDCNIIESNKPLSLPCDNKNSNEYNDKEGCLKIHTAIGDINTQANYFVRWVLGFVLGISGGIVLIIIIISGYKLMTSQGDPEKVKNARDQLTAAIVGLLFIIFSLVILQLITKDILQLPGFGQ